MLRPFACSLRGLKSWPYLMAFRSCSISTGRPQKLFYLMFFFFALFCFSFSGFMNPSVVYVAMHVCKI